MGITSHRNCKAEIIISVWLLTVCMLCGCDPYFGKRPTDYPSSKWVCEDPDICFSISEDGEIHWEIGGAETSYTLIMGMGTNFWIYDRETAQNILEGDSSYSSQKMSVVVEKDLLFGGKYEGKSIVFIRVE